MTVLASTAPLCTPQQFVKSTPRGAYTTVLVREGSKLINWPKHVERLQRSLKAMHEAISGMYGGYYEWLEVRGGLRDCRHRVNPSTGPDVVDRPCRQYRRCQPQRLFCCNRNLGHPFVRHSRQLN
jgi:hypothetical protein